MMSTGVSSLSARSTRRLLVRLALVTSAIAGTLGAAPLVRAQQAAALAPRSALPLRVVPGSSGLDPEALRTAVSRELGTDVILTSDAVPRGGLEIVLDEPGRARVCFHTEDDRRVERVVELPDERGPALEMVALLAGNLARDEAGELLAALRAARQGAQQPDAPEPGNDSPAKPGDAAAPGVQPARAAQPGAPATPRVDSPHAAGHRRCPSASALLERVRARVASEREPAPELSRRPLEAALWTPVGLDPEAPRHRFALALSLAYGSVGGLDGVALGTGAGHVAYDARGFVGTVFWSHVGGTSSGVVLSGLVSTGSGPLRGTELAGLVAHRAGSVQGLQVGPALASARAVQGVQIGALTLAAGELVGGQAGLVTVASGDSCAVQVAGLGGVMRGDACALQLSGLAGVTGGRLAGLQLSGLASWSGHDLSGLQLSPLFNRARDVSGVQIGLVNVARHARGVQLGLVNVSRHMDGAAIGLVSLARNGSVRAVAWHDRGAELNLGVKSRVGVIYSELGWGGDPLLPAHFFSAGLGLHLGRRLFVEADGMVRSEWDIRAANEHDRTAVHERLKLGYELVRRHLAAFAGGGLRHAFTRSGNGERTEPLLVAGVEVF